MEHFHHDQEQSVTVGLAEYLDANGWSVVACHPPGGHTSFSMLDGRRSKSAYMPDIVAVMYVEHFQADVVLIAESKRSLSAARADIAKLESLTASHVDWAAFRLQNHIDSPEWKNSYTSRLQKVVAFEVGEDDISSMLPSDMIAVRVEGGTVTAVIEGPDAPLRGIFKIA